MSSTLELEGSSSLASAWATAAAAFIAKVQSVSSSGRCLPNPTHMQGRYDVPLPSPLAKQATPSTPHNNVYRQSLDSYYTDNEFEVEQQVYEVSLAEEENSVPESDSPVDLQNFPTEELITIVAAHIAQTVYVNDRLVDQGSVTYHRGTSHARLLPWHFLVSDEAKAQTLKAWPSTPFRGDTILEVTVHEYLQRIVTYCHTSNQVLLSLLLYLEKMSELSYKLCATECLEERPFLLTEGTVHRAIIAGVLVGTKVLTDDQCNMNFWAQVGGVEHDELLELQECFLCLNDCDVAISEEELQSFANRVLGDVIVL